MNPYILADTIAQRNESKLRKKALTFNLSKVLGGLLGISGLFYLAGFITLNFIYHSWGFHDFDLSHRQCIYAGSLALAGVSLLFLFSTVTKHLFYRCGKRHLSTGRRRKVMLSILLVSFLLGLSYAYYSRPTIEYLQAHHLAIGYLALALVVESVAFTLFEFVQGSLRLKRMRGEISLSFNLAVCATGILFLAHSLLYLFTPYYQEIPQAWGGAKPEKRIFHPTPEALAYLANYTEHSQTGRDLPVSELIQKEGVWVLHENNDSLMIWTEKSGGFQLPKSWVAGRRWNIEK